MAKKSPHPGEFANLAWMSRHQSALAPIYTTYGQGNTPLILVHGGPGLPGYMKSLGEELQGEFLIYEAYQREAHLSPLPATLTLHADDLEQLLQIAAAGGKRPILLAHSWGAIVALELAKRSPKALQKLVALSPAPLSTEISTQFKEEMFNRLRPLYGGQARLQAAMLESWQAAKAATDSDAANRAFHQYMAIFWRGYFPAQKPPEDFHFATIQVPTYLASLADYGARLSRAELQKELHKIQIPVVHLHGTNDPIPWQATHELLSAHISPTQYQFVALEKMGHFPWVDNPARANFLEALKTCL